MVHSVWFRFQKWGLGSWDVDLYTPSSLHALSPLELFELTTPPNPSPKFPSETRGGPSSANGCETESLRSFGAPRGGDGLGPRLSEFGEVGLRVGNLGGLGHRKSGAPFGSQEKPS